jgi:hypothetical protein
MFADLQMQKNLKQLVSFAEMKQAAIDSGGRPASILGKRLMEIPDNISKAS